MNKKIFDPAVSLIRVIAMLSIVIGHVVSRMYVGGGYTPRLWEPWK